MRKISFFEPPKPIRKESLLTFILAAFVLIVTPAVSLFVITRGERSALYNSLSRLAWSEHLFVPILICVLLNMFTFAFAEILALKKIGFTKPMKIAFLTLTAIIFVVGIVGLSIPCRALPRRMPTDSSDGSPALRLRCAYAPGVRSGVHGQRATKSHGSIVQKGC